MEVFISWSGEASHVVALALKEWLPSVIQSVEPFISSEDIAKGTRWFTEIGSRLQRCHFGIICLTPENFKEPWILFESGAISKTLDEACVAPIVLGMNISELEGPMAQFNATLATKDEIFKLLRSINDKLDGVTDKKLEQGKLEKIFEALWPDLEASIKECTAMLARKKSGHSKSKPKRSTEDLLEELIELNRSNSKILADIPSLIGRRSFINSLIDTPTITPKTRKLSNSVKNYVMGKGLTTDDLATRREQLQTETEILSARLDEYKRKFQKIMLVPSNESFKRQVDIMNEILEIETKLREITCELTYLENQPSSTSESTEF